MSNRDLLSTEENSKDSKIKSFIHSLFIIIALITPSFGTSQNAEDDRWVEYFLDQIAGIRVELSRLETSGVVENLRYDQETERQINELRSRIERLENTIVEQQKQINLLEQR